MRNRSALQLRAAAFTSAALLALGATACGDSDDSAGGGGSNAATSSSPERGPGGSSNSNGSTGGGSDSGGRAGAGSDSGGNTGGSDREQVQAAVEGLYRALTDRDAKAVCGRLNRATQKQFAEGGLAPKTGSCAASFQLFLDKAKKGQFEMLRDAKVKSVEVTGDNAVAKVGFGDKGRNGEIPLVKVDGEWKLATVGATPSK